MRFGFIDHLKGRDGRLFCPVSSSLLPTNTYKHIVGFSRQFPEWPCLSHDPHFPYFFNLFYSLPLAPPPSPISPAAPVPCPLVPKPSKRVIFLKQWGNNLWHREQKEIFTAGVIKWIFSEADGNCVSKKQTSDESL